MKWTETLKRCCLLEISGSIILGRRWCSWHYIQIGRLMAISTVVVLSLLLLVLQENSNKDRLRSLHFFEKNQACLL